MRIDRLLKGSSEPSRHYPHYFVYHSLGSALDDSVDPLEDWPLHCTLTPFFGYKFAGQSELCKKISAIVGAFEPIRVKSGEQVYVGPLNDQLATEVVDPSGELKRLHNDLIAGLGAFGCRFLNLSRALSNFYPHISHDAEAVVPSEFTLDVVTVGKKELTPLVHKSSIGSFPLSDADIFRVEV